MPAASEASRNAAGEFGKPPSGSPIPVPRCVETPRRCPTVPWGIACGLPPAELPGYAIVWVPYVGFHPLGITAGPGPKPAYHAPLKGYRHPQMPGFRIAVQQVHPLQYDSEAIAPLGIGNPRRFAARRGRCSRPARATPFPSCNPSTRCADCASGSRWSPGSSRLRPARATPFPSCNPSTRCADCASGSRWSPGSSRLRRTRAHRQTRVSSRSSPVRHRPSIPASVRIPRDRRS